MRSVMKKSTNKVMKERNYETPDIEVLFLESQGVLCGSNEIMGENEGKW